VSDFVVTDHDIARALAALLAEAEARLNLPDRHLGLLHRVKAALVAAQRQTLPPDLYGKLFKVHGVMSRSAATEASDG
jgi:hypothetical protein